MLSLGSRATARSAATRASSRWRSCVAVNQAVHWIYPDKKVNPGHSSNLAIFGQKDD